VLDAKSYIAISMVLMQAINVVFSSIFFFFPDVVIRVYSPEVPTIEAARNALRLVALGHLVDSVQLLF